jgi:glycerol-3-phosphate dehydrogenase
MWTAGWRDQAWSRLEQSGSPGERDWDIIVIGGGITGAGILRESARAGLRTLLVEQADFGSGTSSRSSKLVHGGFRYLKNAQIRLTYESVRERERLLKEGRGLVSSLGFLLANFRGDHPPGWVYGLGLMVYDLLAWKWGHRYYDAFDMLELCPRLREQDLLGGYRFFDAQTDDARLVLRLIREGVRDGGLALNYTRATRLLTAANRQVRGVALEDLSGDIKDSCEVFSPVVINATGAWADSLRSQVGGRSRLRRLRGSHLILPSQRLPLTRAVSFGHPRDGRYIFAVPWEGVTLVGTTDVDHDCPMETEISISHDEAAYLLEAIQATFPGQALCRQDIQATFAGVRPVIGTGRADPYKESREHVLWNENGLLTVTGGKLTTFRLMAHDALSKARSRLPGRPDFDPRQRILNQPPFESGLPDNLSPAARLRLLGRYGDDTPTLVQAVNSQDFEPVSGSSSLWAELRWAARAEAVVHLDDLLLRRVRIGLTLPNGGLDCLGRIRETVQLELGWDDLQWEFEADRYRDLWNKCYHLED